MRASPQATRQAGFTLIEILIAVIILAIGLLGVASLQLTSKRGNFEAMQRAAATQYAEDLIERMRANPTALGTYVTATGQTFTASPGAAPSSCITSGCSAVAVANFDLNKWWAGLSGANESGAGGLVSPTACLFNPADNEYVIAIAWRGMDEIVDVASATGVTAVDDARDCGRGGGLYDLDTTPTPNTSYRRHINVYSWVDRRDG